MIVIANFFSLFELFYIFVQVTDRLWPLYTDNETLTYTCLLLHLLHLKPTIWWAILYPCSFLYVIRVIAECIDVTQNVYVVWWVIAYIFDDFDWLKLSVCEILKETMLHCCSRYISFSNKIKKEFAQVASSPALYFRNPRFKSRPGHWPPWFMFFVICTVDSASN
jgi:hypothetical protein